MAPGDDVIN